MDTGYTLADRQDDERDALSLPCKWCGEEMGAETGPMHAPCAAADAAAESERWEADFRMTQAYRDGRALDRAEGIE